MALVKRVWHSVGDDHLTIVSAGIAFYLFLALFPAVFAAVSIYGLVADSSVIGDQVDRLDFVPSSARDIITRQLADIAREEKTGLGWGAAVAILLALASAGKGTKAMIKGLNIAYHEREQRNWLAFNASALLVTVSVLAFIAVSFALIAFVPALLAKLPIGAAAAIGAEIVKWLLLLALVLTGLAVIYRYAPCRIPPRWIWVAPGSITAAVLWLAASGLFSWYAASFGDFNETYGLLAGAVIMLLWLQISAFVMLVGAELNSEWERRQGMQ